MVEVALARKIQVHIWAIFGSLYKYEQSGATRRSSIMLHYYQQYNISELEEESSASMGNIKLTILEKIGSRDQAYKW